MCASEPIPLCFYPGAKLLLKLASTGRRNNPIASSFFFILLHVLLLLLLLLVTIFGSRARAIDYNRRRINLIDEDTQSTWLGAHSHSLNETPLESSSLMMTGLGGADGAEWAGLLARRHQVCKPIQRSVDVALNQSISQSVVRSVCQSDLFNKRCHGIDTNDVLMMIDGWVGLVSIQSTAAAAAAACRRTQHASIVDKRTE